MYCIIDLNLFDIEWSLINKWFTNRVNLSIQYLKKSSVTVRGETGTGKLDCLCVPVIILWT